MHRASAEDTATHSAMSTMIRDVSRELAEVMIAEGEMTDRTRAYVWGHAIVGMVQTADDWWLDHAGEVPREAVVDGLVDLVLGRAARRRVRGPRRAGRPGRPLRRRPGRCGPRGYWRSVQWPRACPGSLPEPGRVARNSSP